MEIKKNNNISKTPCLIVDNISGNVLLVDKALLVSGRLYLNSYMISTNELKARKHCTNSDIDSHFPAQHVFLLLRGIFLQANL